MLHANNSIERKLFEELKSEMATIENERARSLVGQLDTLILGELINLETARLMTGCSPESLISIAERESSLISIYNEIGEKQKRGIENAYFRTDEIISYTAVR